MNFSSLALLVPKHFSTKSFLRVSSAYIHTTPKSRNSQFDPDYLPSLLPKIPVYAKLNIEMKGYDFIVLERLQKLAHSLLNCSELEVATGWATRAKSLKITNLEHGSSKVEDEFKLKEYKRVLQLENVPSTTLSVVLEIIQRITPPGVTCTFMEHTPEIEADLYVPDLNVRDLKLQLEELEKKK